NKYTFNSCHKVFCAPWQTCEDGRCICKQPLDCPTYKTTAVCSASLTVFNNYCILKSTECVNPNHRFSSGAPCSGNFEVSLSSQESFSSGILKVKLPGAEKSSFVSCNGWSIKEANVACMHLGFEKGADVSLSHTCTSVAGSHESDCLHASCRGLESSLAECVLKKDKSNENKFAGVNCYTKKRACNSNEFNCANGKCIPSSKSCNGENDCGDLSDELCCTQCQDSFHCKSDICIPWKYKCNNELDCISGEDESNCTERKLLRKSLPELSCGVVSHSSVRQKRIVGGTKALKGQFPWQVAIKDRSGIHCGGVYIGGCWVLTAARCVRANDLQKQIIVTGMIDRLSISQDTDYFPVKAAIVHEEYNPKTYENDIALLETVNIYNTPNCMQTENNMVPACIPWSPFQFKAGDSCTVSGWGRAKGQSKVFHLMWGHVNLMDNCTDIYKERYFDEKMECAGTYDDSVDVCKGDAGGPLICFDANNVAYVWGLISMEENCGAAGIPGVYTKVSHYYEWIGRHVGRSLISKYNN
ncbi:hypothetical protein GDO86_000627, partial [Hymenochirus boettgeri]